MRKACDRCHRLKQKCFYVEKCTSCDSCLSSRLPCTAVRSKKRTGRRPFIKDFGSVASLQVWEARPSDCGDVGDAQSPPTFDAHATGNGHVDGPAVSNLLAEFRALFEGEPFETSPEVMQRFCDRYDHFMLGPSFGAAFRNAYQRAFFSGPDLVKDVFPAIEAATSHFQQIRPRGKVSVGISSGANAVETLRDAHVENADSAFAIMAVGQTLAAFDLLTTAAGVHLILQYSLISAAPFYESLSADLGTDPVVVSSIFWDTIACLMKGSVPTIRYCSTRSPVVDRVAGLCTSLLPLLYDLCKVNADIRRTHSQHTVGDDAQVLLDRLERELRSWGPPVCQSAPRLQFTEHEVILMEAQASLYRKAALIVLHRATGQPLDNATHTLVIEYANSIVADFYAFSQRLRPGRNLRHVIFPLLLAALEIESFPAAIWDTQELLQLAPACRDQLHRFIDFVWARKRYGCFKGHWTQLVEEGPDFVVLP